MDLEEFYNWEKMTPTSIIYLMIKWFDFDEVNLNVRSRPEVASRIWYDVEVTKRKDKWSFSASRSDLIKDKLIKFLDRKNIRKSYLESRVTENVIK